MYKLVNGVQVELSPEEEAERVLCDSKPSDCYDLTDGEWVFNASRSIADLKNLVNDRRVDFESAGVVYTVDGTPKLYQTGGIPHNTNRNYEQNYFDLAAVGLGGVVRATDNTSDTFTPAKVVELCGRVVALAYAIQSSCDTLDAAAEAVTTHGDYHVVKDRIEGSDDWPTTPFPE